MLRDELSGQPLEAERGAGVQDTAALMERLQLSALQNIARRFEGVDSLVDVLDDEPEGLLTAQILPFKPRVAPKLVASPAVLEEPLLLQKPVLAEEPLALEEPVARALPSPRFVFQPRVGRIARPMLAKPVCFAPRAPRDVGVARPSGKRRFARPTHQAVWLRTR